jgi:ABC-type branched-subunit amino acid transport system ATPase component
MRQKAPDTSRREQTVYTALRNSDRAYVLQAGRIVLEGKGDELLQSDLVRQA